MEIQELRGASTRDHGQMSSLLVEADDHLEPLARFPGNECLGLGARRTTWPVFARFDPWSAIVGIAIVVDLIGGLTAKGRVRAMFVVPVEEGDKLSSKRITSQRHQLFSGALVFHA